MAEDKLSQEKFNILLEELLETVGSVSLLTNCKSCNSSYPLNISRLTQGYCPDCAQEAFFGNTSGAVNSIIAQNEERALIDYRAFKHLVPRQRKKIGPQRGG